jgi:tight adherence protein C
MPDFDPALLLTVLLALAAMLAVSALALTLVHRDQTRARVKAVAERRRFLAADAVGATRAKQRVTARLLRKSVLDVIIEKLKLLQQDSLEELKRNMAVAGWRDASGPAKFAVATAVLPLTFVVLGLLLSTADVFEDSRLPMKLILPVALACLGGLMPRFYLKNAMAKRQKAITRAFPDALDLMVICVEAGLSTEASFNRITEEMIVAAPDIAEEFGLLAAECAFMPDRRKPLENLAERTGVPAMRSLSTTLLQSEKYGTPVATGIRVLAQESRETRMAVAERKAAALPAKLTVPMILFFLPVLFGVIAGPAVIQMFNAS